jgi:signal transduction histidine kinase
MPPITDRRLAGIALSFGVVFIGVFAGLVIFHGQQLRTEIRQKMIARNAAVLSPVAQQQVEPSASLSALLPDARRKGMLALAIFDEAGVTVDQVPANQPLVELPLSDFIQLQDGEPITRFFPEFPLAQLGGGASGQRSPVLEIIVPLYRRTSPSDAPPNQPSLLGFVRYHLDARLLAAELTALDDSVQRKTVTSLTLGVALISLVIAAAYAALGRAQRAITERNARLVRSNFELTLSAKASALGQITSHMVHGLQGSVAGLHALASRRDAKERDADWITAADYTRRMQATIQEALALLGDASTHTSYELTGHELAAIIRQRNAPLAAQKNVAFRVEGGFDASLDSHRGGLVCLIANNLVQNAVEATAASRRVDVILSNSADHATVCVADQGCGIPDESRAHLFEPGRSGRPGGSGLGLAISQLLARQIGATLVLATTGPTGTTFLLTVPLVSG